jgi:hypothetical protein
VPELISSTVKAFRAASFFLLLGCLFAAFLTGFLADTDYLTAGTVSTAASGLTASSTAASSTAASTSSGVTSSEI